jgi:GntR family transcriptional regulator
LPSPALPLTLERSSSVPIYVQIRRQLEELIHSGKLHEGNPLPGEPQMADELGVSKMTVRQAISELVAQGLLERQKGRGTFVSSPHVSMQLPYFTSFTQDMRSRGYVPRTELLSIEEATASRRQAERLRVQPGDKLVRIKHLRFADELPMVMETVLIIDSLFPNIIDRLAKNESRYELYEQQYNIRPTRADQELEAVAATSVEASHLGMPIGAPALLIEGVLYDQQVRPVEIMKSVYRADRYKVYLQRTRREFA